MWKNFVLLITTFTTVSALTDKIICYYGTWSVYRTEIDNSLIDNINPSLCTHMVYAYIGVNADGTVYFNNHLYDIVLGSIDKFNALKKQNRNLKTIVSVGGSEEASKNFSSIAKERYLHVKFVYNVITLLQKHDFDGLDLVWKYPAQDGGPSSDRDNFSALLAEFRRVFDLYGYLLTAAVAPCGPFVDTSYDVPQLSKYLDYISVMTFDFHGTWNNDTGHNSPLYASSTDTTHQKSLNVDASIRSWINRGANPKKLLLGIPAYGRTFTLADTTKTSKGAPNIGGGAPGLYTATSGFLGYSEICQKFAEDSKWTQVWDQEQKVPYAYNGDQWLGYENETSVAVKVNYAKTMGLGGIMVWSVETDDIKGMCGHANPILNKINLNLGLISSDTTRSLPQNITSGTVMRSNGSVIICVTVGYIRDPSNCSVFYFCLETENDFIILRFECPAGLYFNLEILVCDYPSEVDCN